MTARAARSATCTWSTRPRAPRDAREAGAADARRRGGEPRRAHPRLRRRLDLGPRRRAAVLARERRARDRAHAARAHRRHRRRARAGSASRRRLRRRRPAAGRLGDLEWTELPRCGAPCAAGALPDGRRARQRRLRLRCLISDDEYTSTFNNAIQRIYPPSGTARIVGRLPTPLAHAMAATVDGRIYVLGDSTPGGPSAAIRRFDPATSRLSVAGRLPRHAPMPLSRRSVASSTCYCAGELHRDDVPGVAHDPLQVPLRAIDVARRSASQMNVFSATGSLSREKRQR
jgi:hypothetical protein